MSGRNGDRSKFNIQRRKKILRRLKGMKLRESLGLTSNQAPSPPTPRKAD